MIPYGLPLIYFTVACDAAPSVRLFLLPLSPPPRGSLKTKEAHHDDEDSPRSLSDLNRLKPCFPIISCVASVGNSV